MKLTACKEDLNGVQNNRRPSGVHVSLYFVKDTLLYEAQLPLNTLSEPLSVNSPYFSRYGGERNAAQWIGRCYDAATRTTTRRRRWNAYI
jgi:hypothetical protein